MQDADPFCWRAVFPRPRKLVVVAPSTGRAGERAERPQVEGVRVGGLGGARDAGSARPRPPLGGIGELQHPSCPTSSKRQAVCLERGRRHGDGDMVVPSGSTATLRPDCCKSQECAPVDSDAPPACRHLDRLEFDGTTRSEEGVSSSWNGQRQTRPHLPPVLLDAVAAPDLCTARQVSMKRGRAVKVRGVGAGADVHRAGVPVSRAEGEAWPPGGDTKGP